MRSLLAAVLLLSAACSNPVEGTPEEGFQIMEDFTMTQTVDQRPLWKLKSPTARITMEGSARLKKPEIMFFRNGKHASTAHALVARITSGSRDITLEGDVFIEAHEEEISLETQKLYFSAKEDRIRSDVEVIIRRPGAVVRGMGMEADSALNDITIFHQETVLE